MTERTGGLSPKDVGRQIIAQIQCARDSSGIDRSLFGRIKEPDVRTVLLNKIDEMVDDIDRFRFPLGAILSSIRLGELSDRAHGTLNPVAVTEDLTIAPFGDGMFLCNDAERLLAKSIESDVIMLVNGVLLVNFIGRNSALALENAITPQGQVFVEGNFYSLSRGQNDLRTELKNRSERGETRSILPKSHWTLLRPLDHDRIRRGNSSMLDVAREAAVHLPDHFGDEVNHNGRRVHRSRLFPRYQ